jgi:hypothetical protein
MVFRDLLVLPALVVETQAPLLGSRGHLRRRRVEQAPRGRSNPSVTRPAPMQKIANALTSAYTEGQSRCDDGRLEAASPVGVRALGMAFVVAAAVASGDEATPRTARQRAADELVWRPGRDDDDVPRPRFDGVSLTVKSTSPSSTMNVSSYGWQRSFGPVPGLLWLRKKDTCAPCSWPLNVDEFSPCGSWSTAIT